VATFQSHYASTFVFNARPFRQATSEYELFGHILLSLAIRERWGLSGTAKDDPKVRERIGKFFEDHRVKSLFLMQERNIGRPHEAELDFPVGQDCPFCPYWKGKQGTSAQAM
jgi:hypothetical protein